MGIEILPNQWYHLAGVFENNVPTIYVNGIPQVITPMGGAGYWISNGDVCIGRHGSWSPRPDYHWGIIDEVAIYNCALSSEEIASHAGGGSSGNTAPVAACQDVTVEAGPGCAADASIDAGSYDPDGDDITITPDPAGPYSLGTTTVTLTATDSHGASDSCTATVTVEDAAPPIIEEAIVSPQVVEVGQTVSFDAVADDECDLMAQWDFGDGAVCPGLSATHAYLTAGIYPATLIVTDTSDNSALEEFFVVVYDPSAGFVTGGGWLWSPEGAFTDNPSATGKANFGFVSKYKKGATVPTGQTEFVFQAGNLNFHSSSYDWLVVTGSNYARFKGTGTINGSEAYKFMLWAGDNVPDTFRIKIWWEEDEIENVVYDNGFDQAIGGGSIVIHTK